MTRFLVSLQVVHCVELRIPAGLSLPQPSAAPSGTLKLSRMRKSSYMVSSPVVVGRLDLEKATARTNREGGVKSPGRPIIPLPPPSDLKSRSPIFLSGMETADRLT